MSEIVGPALVTGAMAATAAVVAAPPDLLGYSLIITSIAGLLGSVFAGVAALKAKNQGVENSKKIEEVRVNTDGKMNDLMVAVKGQQRAEGKAEGKKEEKDDQADRDAVTAAADAIKTMDSKDVEKEAAEQAKKIRADAEIAAEKVINEAHMVSINNKRENPVPMKMVQEIGDDPIAVTETAKRK